MILQTRLMSFLPSAVIESRYDHIENPVHKIYAYIFDAGGKITDVVDKGRTLLIEITVPFHFMKPSKVELYIELQKR